MAVLSNGTNSVKVHDDGDAERVVLYALRNVTAADTLDLALEFSQVRYACLIGTTVVGAVLVATITGSVLTIPAGLNHDAGYLLVFGVHI